MNDATVYQISSTEVVPTVTPHANILYITGSVTNSARPRQVQRNYSKMKLTLVTLLVLLVMLGTFCNIKFILLKSLALFIFIQCFILIIGSLICVVK
jgi:hypothetical protein